MRRIGIYIITVIFIVIIVFLARTAKKYEPIFYVKNIVFENNYIIPSNILLEFIGVSDRKSLSNLSAEIIIDRIEKHPYVKKAEGVFIDSTTLKITLHEVEPFILMVTNSGNYVLTKDKRIIPEDIRLKIIDLPLLTISGTLNAARKLNQKLIDNSFETFSNIQKTDVALLEIVSELNIDDNLNMILYLTKPKGKILLGKSFDKRKALYLSEFWRKIILHNSDVNYEYIDLRFKDQIVVKSLNPIMS